MKLVSTTVFIATAFAAATAAAASDGPASPIGLVPKRDSIGQAIQSNINQAMDNIGDFFGVGHDGSDDDNNNNAASSSTQKTSSKTSAASSSSSTAASSPTNKDSQAQSDSSPTKSSTQTNASSTSSSDDDANSSNSRSSSSSSASPTPSGESCSKNGDKRCPSSGSSTYQQCIKGVWTNQTCDDNNVCGKNNDGDIACVSKDQATVVLESCSTKKEERCDPSDNTKYQRCDGKYWQSGSCSNSNVCLMVNNSANCVDPAALTDTGNLQSYTLFEPSAYVAKTSTASVMRVALGSAAAAFAIALAAASWGF
ncbi:hypothetical protein GGI26_002434 [Coemansia sp. RSA 1358]|uniref:Uncharacterized protein n=1 Tax=Coemansia umbellata TaxID=1424467 RepID=A0ABQ8PMN2_9FUNG|nr:hypothetical protein EDC05_002950 [Coemansia umbellata]KAJ2623396.1 hypothetical protein GGI26_002434 [Coemansia sp. RSA 1358]